MKTKALHLIAGLFLTLYLCSCANLEHINTFATVSTKALASETTIGYSFTQSCEDFDCKTAAGIKGIYYYPVTTDQLRAAYIDTVSCDCEVFKNADKALTTINGVLNAYLTGLANLSDNKAVNYNYDKLVSAVNTTSTKLKISGDEVTALGKIATILTNDLMNSYRRNKLKVIIKKADPDFQIVLTAYIRQMEIFKKLILKNDLITLKSWYSTYLKDNDDKLSPYEKGKIFKDYLDQRAKFGAYESLTNNFISALQKIKTGHAELAKDWDHLTEANAKELINGYSADIFSLVGEFNKIKTSK